MSMVTSCGSRTAHTHRPSLQAFFATNAIIELDGVNYTIQGGFLDHNWKQLYIQIAYIVATSSYTFVVTAALAMLLNYVPGLHLRSTEEGETLGMDDMEV